MQECTMDSECPVYQNVEHQNEQCSYQVVVENKLEISNEYTVLNDNTGSSSAHTLEVNPFDLTSMPARTVRRFNYTDVLLSAPNVPESNEVTADEVSPVVDPFCHGLKERKKRTPPAPPPKPKKTNEITISDEDPSIDDIKLDQNNTSSSGGDKRKDLIKFRTCGPVCVLSCVTAAAIAVSIGALAIAVVSYSWYGSLLECERHTERSTCEITPGQIQHSSHALWLLSNNTCSTFPILPNATNLSKLDYEDVRCEYSASRSSADIAGLLVTATLSKAEGLHFCICYIIWPASADADQNLTSLTGIKVNCTLSASVCTD